MQRREQWTTGPRYFDMAAHWQWRQAREAAPIPYAGHYAGGVKGTLKQSPGIASFQQTLDVIQRASGLRYAVISRNAMRWSYALEHSTGVCAPLWRIMQRR